MAVARLPNTVLAESLTLHRQPVRTVITSQDTCCDSALSQRALLHHVAQHLALSRCDVDAAASNLN